MHLKQFEGDGRYHEIESLLGDLTRKNKQEIFQELAREDLIYLDGGRFTGIGIVVLGYKNGRVKQCGNDMNSEYIPFKGKLTLKGSKYLKEELQMIEKNSYNISIGNNSTANVIVESPGVVINNKQEIIDKANKIIEVLQQDKSINDTTKTEAIETFETLITGAKQGSLEPPTVNKILSTASNISSIGSLALSLIQLFMNK